jgi:hypothetical protein
MSENLPPLPPDMKEIEPIAFDAPGQTFNASEIVDIGDSTFLFCDNNTGGELLELRLDGARRQVGSLLRRALNIPAPLRASDLEGMTLIGTGSPPTLVIAPSYGLKKPDVVDPAFPGRGETSAARSVLLRSRLSPDGSLATEVIPDFRSWLVANCRDEGVRESADLLPDVGGLNIEAVSWDEKDKTLLFGVRTPVVNGTPYILRVGVHDPLGPWELANFTMLDAVRLQIRDFGEEQGIRAIAREPEGDSWLVVVGNSTSKSEGPFLLYRWDGNEAGTVAWFRNIRFRPKRKVNGEKVEKMKVEGICRATVGGVGAYVFVDDGGGYQTLVDDDPRLSDVS